MKQVLITKVYYLALSIVAATMMVACSEEIDTSNRYTFTDETVLSYLEKNEQYSEYVALLYKVPISTVSKSTVAQLLSARGNFTCFAPNNDAIQLYLDSLYRKNIIDTPSWDGFRNEQDLDSIRKVIVYNSIINGGDVKYYEIASFPEHDNEEFDLPNMNDRKLSVVRNNDSIYINGVAPISLKNRDIEAINGRVHEVLEVIAPSNETLLNILEKWAYESGTSYSVMARLLLKCGLASEFTKTRDEEWETLYTTGAVIDLPKHNTFGQVGTLPEHRYYGFTVFAEPDELWEAAIGKSAADITIDDVVTYLSGTGAFTEPGTTTDTDYESKDNILNQFVTYHVLPERISRNKLVFHYNEYGYNYKSSKSYTIAISDFYTTMGKPRLLKVFESAESNGIYLNRFPVLRNGRGRFSPENENINDYHESGDFKPIRGTALRATENIGVKVMTLDDGYSTENVINGIVYPISDFLVCTENVRNQMMGQRIRIDASTMFPEMMNNDLRAITTPYAEGATLCRAFPVNYNYLADVDMMEGTQFYYLPGLDCGWANLESDEYNVIGRYEFTMKLPPVPKAGHYELRFGVATGTQWRGMCQVYWGTDKNNLPARGIPMDLRMGGQYRRLLGVTQPSTVGWEADTEDQEYNDEVEKKMRNIGFMKAPNSWCQSLGSTDPVRNREYVTRRILVSEHMEPNTDYYIKFKSVLDDEKKEFFMDYIEYCAKEVYDNPEESEDIW